MKEKEKSYNPQNPNANIHGFTTEDGEITCVTANDTLCTGCCWALAVREINKEAGKMCPHQEPSFGCKILGSDERPKICQDYHCSQDIQRVKNPKLAFQERRAAFQRLTLSNEAAFVNEEITFEQREKNLEKHIPRV